MLKRPVRLSCLLALCSLLVACTNMHDVVGAHDKGLGTPAVYPVSEQQAWKITNTILKIDRPSAPVEERRGEGYVLLKVSVSSLGSGTYIGVWVDPVSATETKVTFVRKQRVASDTIRAWTAEGFHRNFKELVALLGNACTGAPASSASAPASSASAPASSASAPASSSSAPPVREIPLPPLKAP
jgi:hypothetical protein